MHTSRRAECLTTGSRVQHSRQPVVSSEAPTNASMPVHEEHLSVGRYPRSSHEGEETANSARIAPGAGAILGNAAALSQPDGLFSLQFKTRAVVVRPGGLMEAAEPPVRWLSAVRTRRDSRDRLRKPLLDLFVSRGLASRAGRGRTPGRRDASACTRGPAALPSAAMAGAPEQQQGDGASEEDMCVVSTIAGSRDPAWADGLGPMASFRGPLGVACDNDGLLYVADSDNRRIRRIKVRTQIHARAPRLELVSHQAALRPVVER